jgi:hypothetical protein
VDLEYVVPIVTSFQDHSLNHAGEDAMSLSWSDFSSSAVDVDVDVDIEPESVQDRDDHVQVQCCGGLAWFIESMMVTVVALMIIYTLSEVL